MKAIKTGNYENAASDLIKGLSYIESKQPIYYTHENFLTKADDYVDDFRAKNKRNPTNEEYRNATAKWLG